MISLVRLIASDLDGTLLRSDDTISDRTCSAIQAAQRSGIQIVLVTARPPRSVRWIAERLGINGVAICTNGAIDYDLEGDTILRNEYLSTELALELSRTLRDEDDRFTFAAEHGHRMGYEPSYPQNPDYIHVSRPKIAMLSNLCTENITKLFVHHPNLSIDELMTRINRHLGGKATATHSGEAFVEICGAGISKASGLERFCRDLGLDRQHVIAFGDMPNDLPMLSFAGYAVAVENAHPDILRIADEVTSSNDSDGVAKVIERLLSM